MEQTHDFVMPFTQFQLKPADLLSNAIKVVHSLVKCPQAHLMPYPTPGKIVSLYMYTTPKSGAPRLIGGIKVAGPL
jgi:hypothetical protein